MCFIIFLGLKQVISILLLATFILPNLSRLGVYVNFKLNQSYITQEFCANKNLPELECYGKCYLSEQLKKVDEKEQKNLTLTVFQKLQSIISCLDNGNFSLFTYLKNTRISPFSSGKNFYSSLYVKGVFHPPR